MSDCGIQGEMFEPRAAGTVEVFEIGMTMYTGQAQELNECAERIQQQQQGIK